jgi:hypothetical protein
MRKLLFFAIIGILPYGLSAARLTLRDGTVVNGKFVSGTEASIVFQDDNGVRRRFDVNQIQNIDFNQMSAQAGQYNDRTYNNNDRTYNDQQNGDRPAGWRASGADRAMDRHNGDWAVLPAGTTIAVRTDQSISEQNASEGRTFPASIEQDVRDSNGNVVIPRGSQAALVIRRMAEGGTLSSGSYVLDLDSIQVNGRRYVVNTEDVKAGDERGIGKNRRTAEMVGGGAVLGTLLGAIAGGGKGAAIGAVAGAAAGGGVQVLTKGREIRVPAETVLNFRLEQPLHLREA